MALSRWSGALALFLAAAFAPSAFAAGTAASGTVETVLADALVAELGAAVPVNARVTVQLTAPVDGPVENVRNLVHDPRTGHIRALATSGGRTIELRGKVGIVVDIPVPTRRILPGEVIGDADLTEVAMPMERLNDTVVTDRTRILGQAGRRQLIPGRPIQTSAVGAPIVVERNKPVQLLFEDGDLRLSAHGRALQDGGVGDVVRVMNVASNTVVTGAVTGPKTVRVGGGTKTVETLP
jgi:flagellar basal body P-ring formation protein FlgA